MILNFLLNTQDDIYENIVECNSNKKNLTN